MHGVARRRGFTLVEVLIAAALGVVLMGGLYLMAHTGTRIHRDTEWRAEALQSATLALAAIAADVKRMVSLPIERGSDGAIRPRGGDRLSPVTISPRGQNLSFYVPRPESSLLAEGKLAAVAVEWKLVPSPVGGLYRLQRDEVGDGGQPGSSRTISGVHLEELAFRLIRPGASLAADRSPDENMYLEAKVVGSDSGRKETLTLANLWRLDVPGLHPATPERYLNERIAYDADAPLALSPEVVNYTEEEGRALERLRELSSEFSAGRLTGPELEGEVARLLDGLAGRPGRNPVWYNPGREVLPPVASVRLVGSSPERPLEFETDSGDPVLVPVTPDQLERRLDDEAQRGGAGGGVSFTMTFHAQRWVNGRLVSEEQAADGGTVDYSTDGGADVSRLRTGAMDQAHDRISDFFRNHGLPPPRFN